MTEHIASRTLLKSPPELWAEVSDPAALARHLGEFGEIVITRIEPESAVAWEGDRVRGTVALEPAGWGTRVTLRAERLSVAPPARPPAEPAAPAEPPAPAEPAPPPPLEPPPAAGGGWRRVLARLRARRAAPPPAAARPPAAPPPAPPRTSAAPAGGAAVAAPSTPPPSTPAGREPGAVLHATLDRLGAAHHRPYSRA